jgi:4-amino-4-deoxy-L-arabinose transferase-like glycosyltransferase
VNASLIPERARGIPHRAGGGAGAPPRRRMHAARGVLRQIPGRAPAGWRGIPRAGRACFLIALVNAAVWGVVVPPFQVPDEISHFGYAQYLAETGAPPPQGLVAQYSPQEQRTLEGLDFFAVIGHPGQRGILTPAEDRSLREMLATHPSPVGQGGTSSATNQPPLYYALEAIPYRLSPSQDILTRLALMRLLSALMAAGTVLAVFLFLRELMPQTPWTWTVGALAVAFQPSFDFIAAGVHGDNMLFLACALMFLALARAYRRGLTERRAAAIGLVAAAGTLSKLTFLALLPGVALAVALLAWRAAGRDRRSALRSLAISVALVVLPFALYALLNAAVWRRGGPTAGGIAGATNSSLPGGGVVTMHETLDYIWELYLPRLWFMHHTYFSTYPLIATWLDGAVGHFGWLDYTFPSWVYEYAKYAFYALLALTAIGFVRLRAGVRRLVPLAACFAVMAIGLLGAIGYAGIRYKLSTGFPFEQARYLFPLLALYGLFVVLAARALPGRWARVLGALLVVLAMAHGLFAETLTISRYYG